MESTELPSDVSYEKAAMAVTDVRLSVAKDSFWRTASYAYVELETEKTPLFVLNSTVPYFS